MDGAMGQEEDVVEAVLTCEGDFHDPELNSRIERFRHRLKDLLLTEKQRLQVKKVEPWNSVKVTFTIPREAAIRLRQLAQSGNDTLRQMGVLSVQIQGDTQISLTIAGRNNESTQLVLCTPPASQISNSSVSHNIVGAESSVLNSEELDSSQGSSSEEFTRKNIVHYLRQGSAFKQNQSLFDTILGTGASTVPVLGFGLDIPQSLDSVSGPSGSNTIFRPNNTVTATLPNQVVGGSHLSSSFPFSKTTGAFHPPVPRVPFSAGQRSATNSTHHLQSGIISSGRLMGPLGHDAQNTRSSLLNVGPNGHMFQHNLNTFSPVSALRLSPSTSSSLHLHAPPSSPTSSFMIDLPPPPPYPNSSNASRQGRPVTSSSPLLVNLLQTDPLAAAAAGLASSNPNKSLTTGELTSYSPPKKKHQSKKTKDELMKSFLIDSTSSSKTGVNTRLLASAMDSDRINSRMSDTVTSVDIIQSRLGLHPANHIPDSYITSSLPDSQPLFSSDHSVRESHTISPSLEEFHMDLNSRSAIGDGFGSSNLSNSSGQEPFPPDLDPFSMEIAAGKIINPYTGQLEARDSVVDNMQVRVSDQTSHSQGDNFATQMLAKKAKELQRIHENSVPNLSSRVFDVHVMKTPVPINVNVATSTAVFVDSSGPLQTSSDKLTSFSAHRRNLIGGGSTREIKESSVSSSVYAMTNKPWQEVEAGSDLGVQSLSRTLSNSSPRRVSSSLSSTHHKNFASAHVPHNGPLAGGQRVNMNPPQHQHIAVSSSSSGLLHSPQGSVIYSSVAKSAFLPLPVSHHAYVSQTRQQLISATAPNQHVTAPSNLQNSLSNTTTSVSSSFSHASRLGSTSFTSSQPPQVQATERLKTDSNHIPNQHNQAASSDIAEGSLAHKTSSSNLLNSLPDKHTDSRSSADSPLDNKTSSEGDENSNHSGLITETLPEHSGTAALLEHSGVKAENHDSGVGSSSERSDDTPSEPGDGEFRSGQVGAEIEDGNKTSLHKTINCKQETRLNSSSNTITVGYMVNPHDGTKQAKRTQVKDTSLVSKSNVITSASPSTVSDISQFFHAHIMSMDKQAGLLTNVPQTSATVALEGSTGSSHTSFPGKVRENGQGLEDMGNLSSLKINGPSSQSNIVQMIRTSGSDSQHKKTRSSPKQNSMKGLMGMSSEHLKLQPDVLEKMSKLQQFAESTKDTLDVLTKSNISDKSDSPDALSQRLNVPEDRPEQLIFDLEELVNGRTGHGNSGIESKGGSNITSIYSKRSSPVNVNMLNHIYAPGLPLLVVSLSQFKDWSNHYPLQRPQSHIPT